MFLVSKKRCGRSALLSFLFVLLTLQVPLVQAKTVKQVDGGLLPIAVFGNLPVEQNALNFIPQGSRPQLPFASKPAEFLADYFGVWSEPSNLFCAYGSTSGNTCRFVYEVEEAVSDVLEEQKFQKYYNERCEQYTAHDAAIISANMKSESWHDGLLKNRKAIMVQGAVVKEIPIATPLYFSPTVPGQGFRFDMSANASLAIGTPISVLLYSKDQEWALIKGDGSIGWVLAKSFVELTEKSAQNWMRMLKTSAVVITDQFTYLNPEHKVPAGTVLPCTKLKNGLIRVFYPVSGKEGDLTLNSFDMSNSSTSIVQWPVEPTYKNLAFAVNKMLGMPYSWGDERYFFSDCSGTLKRIFAQFGIWMPRNSYEQTLAGDVQNLSDLSGPERLEAIVKDAKPFSTFIALSSHAPKGHEIATPTHHIMLYLGHIDGMPVVFHNVWGVHIVDASNKSDLESVGRLLAAGSVVTRLDFGLDLHPIFKKYGYDSNYLYQNKGIYLSHIK